MIRRSLGKFDGVPYYKNPVDLRNWEMHALAVSNTFRTIVAELEQCEVRFLEEYVKTNPHEHEAHERLSEIRASVLILARSAGYSD